MKRLIFHSQVKRRNFKCHRTIAETNYLFSNLCIKNSNAHLPLKILPNFLEQSLLVKYMPQGLGHIPMICHYLQSAPILSVKPYGLLMVCTCPYNWKEKFDVPFFIPLPKKIQPPNSVVLSKSSAWAEKNHIMSSPVG